MKIKVFTPNINGKIEFTPAELEKLLNDTFAEGQKECNCNKSITWTNPYLNLPMCYQDEKITITDATSNDKSACEMSKRIDEVIKNATARIDNDAFSRLAKELNF